MDAYESLSVSREPVVPKDPCVELEKNLAVLSMVSMVLYRVGMVVAGLMLLSGVIALGVEPAAGLMLIFSAVFAGLLLVLEKVVFEVFCGVARVLIKIEANGRVSKAPE